LVYSTAANKAKIVVQVCYFGLILLFTLSTFMRGPEGVMAKVVVLAILVMPLLIFISGIMKGNARSYVLLCFIMLFYFCVAVYYLFLPPAGIIDGIRVGLITSIFIAAMFYVRWQSRALSEEQDIESDEEKEHGK
jgi:uncharacterized membrane protein